MLVKGARLALLQLSPVLWSEPEFWGTRVVGVPFREACHLRTS